MARHHWNGGAVNHQRRIFLAGALGLLGRLLGDISTVEGEGYPALSGSLRLAVAAYEQRMVDSAKTTAHLNSVMTDLFQKVSLDWNRLREYTQIFDFCH